MSGLAENRNIVLGITGSIAAYKAAELARLFVSRGYMVRAIMTHSAQQFIAPLTLQSVTGHAVTTDFWDSSDVSLIEHIQLADWANVLVVAPASADLVAKMAHGHADTPLLATLLATHAPIVLAPAMNVNMYEHTATQQNIDALKKRGILFVDPEEGALACGWNGTGRLAEAGQIFYCVRRQLSRGDYRGKKLLITTGPTREPIDPVRFVSNRSSGKMGVALAQEAFCRGADVTLIHGPCSIEVPADVRRVAVTTALEMHAAVIQHACPEDAADTPDVIIMAAAVADYRPSTPVIEKIKRSRQQLQVDFVENPDILLELGKRRGESDRPILVGFAVETGEIDELIDEAREKLRRKNADIIVGNFAADAFDLDTNRAWIVDRTGRQEEIATTFKSRVANKVLDAINRL